MAFHQFAGTRARKFIEHLQTGLHVEECVPCLRQGDYQALAPEARIALDRLAAEGELTLADLAREMKLDVPQAQAIIQELLEHGWVQPVGLADRQTWRLHKRHDWLMAHESPEYLELRKQVVHRVVHYTRYRVVAIALGFALQVLLARHMGVQDYGIYSLVTNLAAVFTHFIPLGFGTTVVRYLPGYAAENEWGLFRGLVQRSFHVSLTASGLVFLVGVPLIVFNDDLTHPEKFTYLLGLFLGMLGALTDLVSCLLEGEKRFDSAFFLDIFLPPVMLVAAILGLIWIYDQIGHLLAISATVGVQFVLLAIMLIVFLRTNNPQYGTQPASYKTKKWFKTAIPVLVMAGFMVLIYRADLFVVGMLLGHKEAGIYAAVLNISGFLAFFLKGVDTATNPEISPLFRQGKIDVLQKLSILIARLSFWPTLIIGMGFIIFSHQLLDLFGDGFRSGASALHLLCLFWVIKGASGAPGYLLLMTGHQFKLVKNYSMMVILDVGLQFLLIWWFSRHSAAAGLTGAALASTLALLTSRAQLNWLAKKYVGIDCSVVATLRGTAAATQPSKPAADDDDDN